MSDFDLTARIIVRVDQHTRGKIRALAAKRGVTVSDLIRDALEPHLNPSTANRAALESLLRKFPGRLARG